MFDLGKMTGEARSLVSKTDNHCSALVRIRKEVLGILTEIDSVIASGERIMKATIQMQDELSAELCKEPQEPTKAETAVEFAAALLLPAIATKKSVEVPATEPLLPVVVKNNILGLFSADSPLLDIFAQAPWLHDGRGFVTVGTDGFQWDTVTDLSKATAEELASLPTGFYGSEANPEYVIIRMKTCILQWNFKLDAFDAIVFIVGLSDQGKDGKYIWYRANTLSSTFSKRLYDEVAAFALQYKR